MRGNGKYPLEVSENKVIFSHPNHGRARFSLWNAEVQQNLDETILQKFKISWSRSRAKEIATSALMNFTDNLG
jgi:hypothetical protein